MGAIESVFARLFKRLPCGAQKKAIVTACGGDTAHSAAGQQAQGPGENGIYKGKKVIHS